MLIYILFFLIFINKILILAWNRTVDMITTYEIEREQLDPVNMNVQSPLIFAYLMETNGDTFI